MFLILIHVTMMHIPILIPDTCMYDAFINFPRSSTLMHVCMMHTSIILDPDTFVYDACIYDAANLSFDPDTYIYLMHVCTMHIHMLLDHDAYVHDAYICDIQSLTMLHVCMMRLKFCYGRTNQPTNKAILGVGF